MAEETTMTAVIDGRLTRFSVVKIISEHRGSRKCRKGERLVQAVIRAGQRTETRHICLPE